jgi:hypothetical protein
MGDLSRKTARHLLTAMTTGVIMSRSRNMGLEALVARGHATDAPLLNIGGARILQHVAYTITPSGRAWLDETAVPIIRESTKSEHTPAAIALHRWTAEIDYRHDDGIRTSTRGLHELAELHDVVEAGPSFYAIAGIRIGAPRYCDPVTVEEAAQL